MKMPELTLEQAERSARACGWEKKEHTPSKVTGGWKYSNWLRNDKPLRDDGYNYMIPTDPHSWRPRLEERLEEMAQERGWRAIGLKYNWNRKPPGYYPYGIDERGIKQFGFLQGAHPCLALCAAIESLEADNATPEP